MDDWKITISVLWLIALGAYVAHAIVVLLDPHILAGMLAGKINGQSIGGPVFSLGVATLMLIPLVMAFLSLILNDSINRWANTVVGAVYAFIFISNVVDALMLPNYGGALLTFAAFFASVLIVWYAWTSKQERDGNGEVA